MARALWSEFRGRALVVSVWLAACCVLQSGEKSKDLGICF